MPIDITSKFNGRHDDEMTASRIPVFLLSILIGFGLTYIGSWPFYIMVAVLWIGMVLESSHAGSLSFGLEEHVRRLRMMDLLGLVLAVGLLALWVSNGYLFLFFLWPFVWIVSGLIFSPSTPAGLNRWLFSVVVQTYIAVGVSSFMLLRRESLLWAVIAVLVAFISDTVAYVAGSAWGRRKLAPSISPNKTIVGAVYGFIACVAGVTGVVVWSGNRELGPAILISSVLAGLSILGDLLESFLKRGLGIKDFGTSLPGHGGILDRVDSLLLISPGLYILLRVTSSA